MPTSKKFREDMDDEHYKYLFGNSGLGLSGKSKDFGFVSFKGTKVTQTVVDEMDRKELNEKQFCLLNLIRNNEENISRKHFTQSTNMMEDSHGQGFGFAGYITFRLLHSDTEHCLTSLFLAKLSNDTKPSQDISGCKTSSSPKEVWHCPPATPRKPLRALDPGIMSKNMKLTHH
eukprot:bmy_20349T0